MRLPRLLLVSVACLGAFAPRLCAQASGGGLVLEMSTDMVRVDAPSTRLFLGWHRDVNALFRAGMDGAGNLLDLGGPEKKIERLALLSAFVAANAVASRAFSITAHDQAHMEAALATGASRAYLVRSSDPAQEMSVWEFLLESFNPVSEPGLYAYLPAAPTAVEQAYVAGEGLDTNLVIAASIAAAMDAGEGHVMDLAPYVLNKLWGVSYFLETGPTSDAGTYLDLLGQQGWAGITREEVIALHAASCLASGGFLGLVGGAFNFVNDGRTTVMAPQLRLGEAAVFWPEVTTWLNPDNVSVLVSTQITWSGFLATRAGIELPVLGNTASAPEVTLGSELMFGGVSFGMEVTSHSIAFPFLKGAAQVRAGGSCWIGIEGFYGQGNTQRERREYPAGPGGSLFLRARL
jgi:hypothetical protein